MRRGWVNTVAVSLCSLVFVGCANESLAGLQLDERAFTGSYLVPSQALTAGARATSAVPTAAASEVFSDEQIKALANKTLQINDDWIGPICQKYKVYNKFFNDHIDFNTGDEGLTTGGKFTAQALQMVKEMKSLAKNKEQKEWTAYAERVYDSIVSGTPTAWDGGWPVKTDVDWLAAGWTKEPLYEPNQPAIELATLQAAMAACLKLK